MVLDQCVIKTQGSDRPYSPASYPILRIIHAGMYHCRCEAHSGLLRDRSLGKARVRLFGTSEYRSIGVVEVLYTFGRM